MKEGERKHGRFTEMRTERESGGGMSKKEREIFISCREAPHFSSRPHNDLTVDGEREMVEEDR